MNSQKTKRGAKQKRVLETLEAKGYVRTSQTLRDLFYKSASFRGRYKRFSVTSTLGSTKYSSTDIFGRDFTRGTVYYYDSNSPSRFVAFLTAKFYLQNPKPPIGLKRAFTWLLHNHNLHWVGCGCDEERKQGKM